MHCFQSISTKDSIIEKNALRQTIFPNAMKAIQTRKSDNDDHFHKCSTRPRFSFAHIQTKLKVSEPNDIYEQEADRIAVHVMKINRSVPCDTITVHGRQQETNPNCKSCETVHEKEEHEQKIGRNTNNKIFETNLSEDSVRMIDNVLNEPGTPLNPSTREFMESRFGYDFSKVRIHYDERASTTAQRVNALAYTSGNHIVFRSAYYYPETSEERLLLAHELVHVIQQGNGRDRSRLHQPNIIQRQSSTPKPTIPIPVFDELDPMVIVPDLPGVPDFLKGQEIKLS